jgi:hypothetical protein
MYFRQNTNRFQIKGKIYLKGQIIESNKNLAAAFPNMFTLVTNLNGDLPASGKLAEGQGASDVPPQPEKPQEGGKPAAPAQSLFALKHIGAGYYNVVRASDGAVMNQEKMQRAKALALIESLSIPAPAAPAQG